MTQIRVLGEWSVVCNGKAVATGPNQRAVLHALVMSRGDIDRGDLKEVLPNRPMEWEKGQKAIRNALTYLRKELKLDISENANPVTMGPTQAHASIDLWDFFAHVESEDYAAARALIAKGQEPRLLETDAEHNELWATTLEEFAEAKRKVSAAFELSSGRRRSMLDTRERLLKRSLVPGVGRQVPISAVRERLEPLTFPWRWLRPEAGPGGRPLPGRLAELLAASDAPPQQLIVVGPPGAGKTLTAILTFLQLTDRLEGSNPMHGMRPVLYVDAHTEGAQRDFATDTWFERRLHEMDAVGHGQPVVIMPHADAFLSRDQEKLGRILNWRVFRDHDILLCCGEQFYSKGLRYEEYGTHVMQLEPWSRELQRAFALAVFNQKTCRAFERWRDADETGTRAKLCMVPLHLAHVLPLVDANRQALNRISTRWHLFDQVARMRLGVAGHSGTEEELFWELAALAHRFYTAGTPADTPIGFNLEDLRQYLRARSRRSVRARVETIVNHTLLVNPQPGSDELRFEEPSWGWFFLARHLVHTLTYSPQEALRAFSKFLSADVMELCEEILRDALVHHHEPILDALRFALWEDTATDLSPSRRTIAREQIGYLLGAIGDGGVRAELAALMDSDAGTWEPDPLVRRGIAFGLANGGAAEFADRYVQVLRDERARGEAHERSVNIGFFLSFRGDQPYDHERPGEIGVRPEPVRTVADLVRGLEEDRHCGSWRIKLFTLVDLAQHPAIEPECYERAIAPYRERLNTILQRLEADSQRSEWVELAELREQLDDQGAVAA